MRGKRIVILLLTLCLLLSNFTIVYATDTTEATEETTEATTEQSSGGSQLGNDGYARDNPFGDCGADLSFGGDAKYYDFLIPYNLSLKDIGGYATEVFFDAGSDYVGSITPTEGEALNKKCYNLNRQGSKGSTWLGLTVNKDSDTGFQYVEKNGVKFYIASLPKAIYDYSAVNDGTFYGGAMGTHAHNGYVYDVILKDGTILHFATGDAIGTYHANNDVSDSRKSGGQDGVNYTFAKLNYPQYKRLFHASPSNQLLECFCDSGALSKFQSHYNIGESNPIVAIRMWNFSLKDGDFTANTGFTELATKGSAIKEVGSGRDDSSSTGSDGMNIQFCNGFYEESSLSAWCKLTETNIDELYLDDATIQNLNGGELSAVTNWKNNVDAIKEETAVQKIFRVGTQLVGILFSVWMLLLYLGFWFDRLNNFFEFSVVEILSFGRLRVSDTEEECTFRATELSKTDVRTVNHRAILTICLVGLAFGVLIITGILYSIISKIVVTAINFFK